MLSLQATIRDKKTKTELLRKQGFLPAILYGEEVKNTVLFVPEKDFEKIFNEAGETSMITLDLEGKKVDVLIHQIAKDPVSGKIIHIDLFHPSSKKKMEAEIPLVFEGESQAVNAFGGVLIKAIQELRVRGLAKDLPKEIIVDVSLMKEIDSKIEIKDLKLPLGLELIGHHPEDAVAHIAKPKEEKIEKPKEAPAEGEAAAEISTDEKKEEKAEK